MYDVFERPVMKPGAVSATKEARSSKAARKMRSVVDVIQVVKKGSSSKKKGGLESGEK